MTIVYSLNVCWIWQRGLMLVLKLQPQSLSQLQEEYCITLRKHCPCQINSFVFCPDFTHPFPSSHGVRWYTNDTAILSFSTNPCPCHSLFKAVGQTELLQSSPLTFKLCFPISKVTPACTDSALHRPALSETQQNTHNWVCSGMEFSPGFYGCTANKLIITSHPFRIGVTDKDITASVTLLKSRLFLYITDLKK